jgi:hypothetical protein
LIVNRTVGNTQKSNPGRDTLSVSRFESHVRLQANTNDLPDSHKGYLCKGVVTLRLHAREYRLVRELNRLSDYVRKGGVHPDDIQFLHLRIESQKKAVERLQREYSHRVAPLDVDLALSIACSKELGRGDKIVLCFEGLKMLMIDCGSSRTSMQDSSAADSHPSPRRKFTGIVLAGTSAPMFGTATWRNGVSASLLEIPLKRSIPANETVLLGFNFFHRHQVACTSGALPTTASVAVYSSSCSGLMPEQIVPISLKRFSRSRQGLSSRPDIPLQLMRMLSTVAVTELLELVNLSGQDRASTGCEATMTRLYLMWRSFCRHEARYRRLLHAASLSLRLGYVLRFLCLSYVSAQESAPRVLLPKSSVSLDHHGR